MEVVTRVSTVPGPKSYAIEVVVVTEPEAVATTVGCVAGIGKHPHKV